MFHNSRAEACLNDDKIGPAVQGCRADFDFTQLFEKSILWCLPSSIFILIALPRFLFMLRKPRIVSAFNLQILKSLSIVGFTALQVALLVISAQAAHNPLRRWTIVGSLLAFVAGSFMLLVSFVDHSRSPRSSFLLSGYLFLSILFDAAQTRTLWNDGPSHHLFTSLFTASITLKLAIFTLELVSKYRWIDSSVRATLPPEATSNIFNIASYFWLRDLLWRGFNKVLAISDLYPLNGLISTALATPKLQHAIESLSSNKLQGDALLFCLFRAFPYDFLLPVVPRAAKIGLNYAQSFLMQSLLRYLGSGKTGDVESRNTGYGLIGGAVLVFSGLAVVSAFKSYFVSRLNSMVRAALCALVYRKTTRLEVSNMSDAAPLTLMSTDINMVRNGIFHLHEVWGNAAEFAIGCWLLYNKVGIAFIVPTIVVVSCLFPLAGALVFLSKRQDQWMSKIQARINITSKVLSNIKAFKMLGIAPLIGKMVDDFRIDEVRAGNKFRVFQLFVFVLSQTPLAIAAPITFSFTSNNLTTSELFGALSYVILLANPLDALIQSLPTILTAIVSLRRIQTFLALPEMTRETGARQGLLSKVTPFDNKNEKSESVASADFTPNDATYFAFRIRGGSFSWQEDKLVLKHITLDIRAGCLTIIAGAVGSGKSTLCNALIGQIPFGSSSVESAAIGGSIGYCSSKPFLWNGTIQENIIGYNKFDERRYVAVLDATMLCVDIALLPLGSDTPVGNRGSSLSGGQRQRVSLARALYSYASVFILDDVLSGLDAKTENQVFERVMGRDGLIRQRGGTVVFCTHAVRYLPEADHVVVLDGQGNIAEQGAPGLINYHLSDEDDISSIDGQKSPVDAVEPAAELSAVKESVEPRKLKTLQLQDAADASRQMGDKRVYGHYLRGMGRSVFMLILSATALVGFANNFSTVWLNFWSADAFHFSRSQYLGVYGGIGGFELALNGVGGALLLLVAVPRIGRRLHHDAINTVVAAPLQLFSETTTGVITNLFSQDISLVDMDLPLSFINLLVLLMMLLGGLVVVALPSPYLAIAYPFLFAVLYGLQLFYLRTSRQLRLLDLEAKSPLYNQFLETTEGITTIRSFGWVDEAVAQNDFLLNESQRPAYLLSMSQNFLNTTLNVIVAILATATTALATQLNTNSSLTGASFITLLNLGGRMATLMQSYTDLEISLGAVNRLASFSDANPAEPESSDPISPENSWPALGGIKLQNVSASYLTHKSPLNTADGEQESRLTLNNVSLQIEPHEHVALCGRTGSGKSSLILLLLRLLEPMTTSGSIEIDGVSIDRVDRNLLRQRLLVVPQDPSFLPPGYTIKQNVDLYDEATAEECIEALEQTQLSLLLEKGNSTRGIHNELDGDTLSHGHQQIFGFARALVRKKVRARQGGSLGGVLLLDEPNSKVDTNTDKVMQDVIRTEFANYSVIYISHRLETVMKLCSRVIVLNAGEVVEQGSPAQLKTAPGSWFGALWQEYLSSG